MAQIGAGCDSSDEAMLDATSFLRGMEASWDEVLSKMGQDLSPALFGAQDTEVKACVTFEEDGNQFVALVDVGECMYVCSFLTS
jgi:hypothetical protein